MVSLRCLFQVVAALAFPFAPCAGSCAVTLDPDYGPQPAGSSISTAVVNGNPALVYTTEFGAVTKYVRALGPYGKVWGTPLVIPSGSGHYGRKIALQEVGGNPAICFLNWVFPGQPAFIRALDPVGNNWSPLVTLDTGLDSWSIYPAAEAYCLEVVNGVPAVCFVTGSGPGKVGFVHALDPLGEMWERPQLLTSDLFDGVMMKVVDGRLAIACRSHSGISFLRATDATGDSWGAPVRVTSDFSFSHSLQIVDGRPALSWVDVATDSLQYMRAADASGTAWNAPVTVPGSPSSSLTSSLAVVNGKPQIGYFSVDQPPALKFVQATGNGNAPADWLPPVTVDTAARNGSLFEVNGGPAFVYEDSDQSSLRYVRANMDAGIPRWPADLRMEQPSGTSLPDGRSTGFGGVAPGDTKRLLFILGARVPESMQLTGLSVTVEGPDAVEFFVPVIAAPAAPLDSTNRIEIPVDFVPLGPGFKHAALRVAATGDDLDYSATFPLTGFSLPDIAVERPAGTVIAAGDSINFPLTAAGTAADIRFTIRNTGTAPLKDFAFSFGGPDALEFSVAAAPPSPVPPEGTTSSTIRHAPATMGSKTASLLIESNVPGDRARYPFTLNMVAGMPDETFNAVVPTAPLALATLPNGKILAGGNEGLTVFNPDGSPDTAFPALTVSGGSIRRLTVQRDGKILLGGTFLQAGGRDRAGLARLNANGTLDESFDPRLNAGASVVGMAVQPHGKILIGGYFNSIGDVPRQSIGRLLPDGTADQSFLSPLSVGTVACLALQPDGRILIGGTFRNIGAVENSHIARLNPDGTPDSFAGSFNSTVYCLAVQPDGKIIAGGVGGIDRFYPGGQREATMRFSSLQRDVYDLALQTDGKYLFAGSFERLYATSVYDIPRRFLARVNADGSPDTGFNANLTGNQIRCLSLQADGRLLISGAFTGINGIPRSTFARVENETTATSLLQQTGPSSVRWLRGGTAPEVNGVLFEAKASGSLDWTPLGSGKRIPGGWELPGLTLPSSGTLRASGYAGGSLMESVTPILTALEAWRMQYFDISENTGDAADNADPDHDGLTNFTEFSFGLNPVDRASNALPEFKYTNDSFTTTFTSPEGREDLLYAAEWSATMQPGTWNTLPDSETGNTHRFSLAAPAGRAFVRHRVTMR